MSSARMPVLVCAKDMAAAAANVRFAATVEFLKTVARDQQTAINHGKTAWRSSYGGSVQLFDEKIAAFADQFGFVASVVQGASYRQWIFDPKMHPAPAVEPQTKDANDASHDKKPQCVPVEGFEVVDAADAASVAAAYVAVRKETGMFTVKEEL